MIKKSKAGYVFSALSIAFLIIGAALCLFPIIHILALSLSSSIAASAGEVKLLPVDFTIEAYRYALGKSEFIASFLVSIKRLFLGMFINMIITILSAYTLSKEKKEFPLRDFYAWVFFVTILFSGGLIPTYMLVKDLSLIDTIWALVLPGAVPVFNIVILLNFFRQLPREISESAFMDGAGHWTVLWRIFVPLSTSALATLVLFTAVSHWNAWFDGLIYMNSPKNYPLQSYLQTVVVVKDLDFYTRASREELEMFLSISDRTTRASQIFIAAFPILCVYPFLQKYFVKGIVLGSVKG